MSGIRVFGFYHLSDDGRTHCLIWKAQRSDLPEYNTLIEDARERLERAHVDLAVRSGAICFLIGNVEDYLSFLDGYSVGLASVFAIEHDSILKISPSELKPTD